MRLKSNGPVLVVFVVLCMQSARVSAQEPDAPPRDPSRERVDDSSIRTMTASEVEAVLAGVAAGMAFHAFLWWAATRGTQAGCEIRHRQDRLAQCRRARGSA